MVDFCFRKISVPDGCTIASEYQIKNEQTNFSWIYVSEDNLLFASNGLMSKLETYAGFTKERIGCYLLGHKVNGYRVSYTYEAKKMYQIIAYGIVNNQPVLVQLKSTKNPVQNTDLPDFALQFLRY